LLHLAFAVLALTPVPAPAVTSVTNSHNEQAMIWAESLLQRHWLPSPDVWGHRFCWQLPGDTTVYRCVDGFSDTS